MLSLFYLQFLIILLFNIIVVNSISSKGLLNSNNLIGNSLIVSKDVENNSIEQLTRLNKNFNNLTKYRGGEVISGKKVTLYISIYYMLSCMFIDIYNTCCIV